jgi:hypothetical protein
MEGGDRRTFPTVKFTQLKSIEIVDTLLWITRNSAEQLSKDDDIFSTGTISKEFAI